MVSTEQLPCWWRHDLKIFPFTDSSEVGNAARCRAGFRYAERFPLLVDEQRVPESLDL